MHIKLLAYEKSRFEELYDEILADDGIPNIMGKITDIMAQVKENRQEGSEDASSLMSLNERGSSRIEQQKTDRTAGDDEEVNMRKPAIKIAKKKSAEVSQDQEAQVMSKKQITIQDEELKLKQKRSIDPQEITRRQSVKYMTMDPHDERSSGSPSTRRKTIRESL